ncbi:helix-turn-helix domain-containing protein [Streptomyces paludis]|uniref:helix-turn-helix domain-containing protein n=1 Tax=Streptomyces paludis TaxID=2282738 RepID=UPI0013B3C09C|nr:helix-turn-helix domain-containing protein [Streptomyces paludis]
MPDHVRTALLENVALTHHAATSADELDKIQIYLALEQGATTREVADRLGVSQPTIVTWSRAGKEALARREKERADRSRDDLDRSEELLSNGS